MTIRNVTTIPCLFTLLIAVPGCDVDDGSLPALEIAEAEALDDIEALAEIEAFADAEDAEAPQWTPEVSFEDADEPLASCTFWYYDYDQVVNACGSCVVSGQPGYLRTVKRRSCNDCYGCKPFQIWDQSCEFC